MEVLGIMPSLKQAHRLMAEIVAPGRWELVSTRGPFTVYSKGRDEMTVVKKGTRTWAIIKYVKGEEMNEYATT